MDCYPSEDQQSQERNYGLEPSTSRVSSSPLLPQDLSTRSSTSEMPSLESNPEEELSTSEVPGSSLSSSHENQYPNSVWSHHELNQGSSSMSPRQEAKDLRKTMSSGRIRRVKTPPRHWKGLSTTGILHRLRNDFQEDLNNNQYASRATTGMVIETRNSNEGTSEVPPMRVNPPERMVPSNRHAEPQYTPGVYHFRTIQNETLQTLLNECRNSLLEASRLVYLVRKARQSWADLGNRCPITSQQLEIHPMLIGIGDLSRMQLLINRGLEVCYDTPTHQHHPELCIGSLRRVFDAARRIKLSLQSYNSILTLKGYIGENLTVLNGMAMQLSHLDSQRQ